MSGTYEGYGQKLTIERGILAFNGPLDNPQLNVLALRKGLPVEAGVEILGTTTRPRVRLVSSPDVPEPEKLSWLVLGRGASDASVGDMRRDARGGARAAGQQQSRDPDLTKKLGIDEVKIGRADTNSVLGVLPQSTVAGRTGTPSASEVVSVGKRLNRNLQLTYEQGLVRRRGHAQDHLPHLAPVPAPGARGLPSRAGRRVSLELQVVARLERPRVCGASRSTHRPECRIGLGAPGGRHRGR